MSKSHSGFRKSQSAKAASMGIAKKAAPGAFIKAKQAARQSVAPAAPQVAGALPMIPKTGGAF